MKKIIYFAAAYICSVIYPVSATIINVPDDYTTIQLGMDASNDGDTVLVQPGIYVENINFNGHNIVLGSLFLTTGDTSYISPTIIDGNALGSVVTFESGEDSTTLITGFTIRNGMGGRSGYNWFAGGITCINQSNPVIKNNKIIDNHNDDRGHGGGIYCYFSEPLIENNIIRGNSASYFGGGIYIVFSTSIIRNNLISENSSDIGGGVLCMDYNPLFDRNVITNNHVGYAGSGVFCFRSSPIIKNCTISENEAEFYAGGICCTHYSDPIVINSILWANRADSAEEIFNYDLEPAVIYSDIEGGWEGEGNIDSNPLFVDPDNGDFHLMFGSPCIDTGDPDSPLDPDSTRADMGALYYDQHVGIEAIDHLPKEFYLAQNYPNPFNAQTIIKYDLSQAAVVTIEIYDILGRRVESLLSHSQPAGLHSVIWNADDLVSGMYFYRIQAGDFSKVNKCVLLK